MLAPRFARAAPKLPIPGVLISTWKSTAPTTCKRWQSSEKTGEIRRDLEEARALEMSHPKSKDGERWTYSSNSVQAWDYARMNAGVVNLVPHKDEPDACSFVSEGDTQWLDHHRGVLDSDGKKRRLVVPTLWLRDNCQCAKCVNPDTRQKTFNTFHLGRPQLKKAVWEKRGYKKTTPWIDGIQPEDYLPDDVKSEVLKVHFKDGHVGEYSKRFIHKMLEATGLSSWGVANTWDKDLWHNPIRPPVWGEAPLTYKEATRGKYTSGMFRVVDTLDKWGLITIEDVPSDSSEATQELLEQIGPIRNTHYGGFYDFTADLSKSDTAYTNQALAPHTDTTYFTEPAGLQAFHVLSHKRGKKSGPAIGGETILVDGFRAAVLLEKADPKAFEILSRTRIPWFANGNRDACITPDARYPVIELHPETGEISRVRWNMEDRGAIPLDDSMAWYNAARKFYALVSHPSMQIQFKLKPGTLLIFNNWRVLHGRTAFTGDRRVCGAYINRDDFHSRWRLCKGTNDYMTGMTTFQDHKVLNSSAGARLIRANREKYGRYGAQPS